MIEANFQIRHLIGHVHLKSLLHPGSDSPEVTVDLAGRRTENQADDSLLCNVNVLEATHDVDLGVGQDHSRS